MGGRLTREETLEIVRAPLQQTVGRAEAERVQRAAVANALLEHCGLSWGRCSRCWLPTTAIERAAPKRR